LAKPGVSVAIIPELAGIKGNIALGGKRISRWKKGEN
jgi:hypothetical protein